MTVNPFYLYLNPYVDISSQELLEKPRGGGSLDLNMWCGEAALLHTLTVLHLINLSVAYKEVCMKNYMVYYHV